MKTLKLKTWTITFAASVGFLLCAPLSQAASLAVDNAANYGGGNPWVDGSNGGTGFGNWSFSSGNPPAAFWYLGDSTTNGGGGSGINTGGQAWGMSIGGNIMDAVRPFSVGGANASSSLAVGQGVELSFDNGFIASGGVVGFNLMSGTMSRFDFYFTGGLSNYSVVGASTQNTIAGFTDGGMNLRFNLTGADTFSFTIDFLGGGTETFTGTLGGSPGTGIDNIRLFNFNGDYGASNNQYFNSLAIVPEPSVVTLLAAGLVLLWVLRRRRHSAPSSAV